MPDYQSLRQQFMQTPSTVTGGNLELIEAVGRLEAVMKEVQSPTVHQSNSTTNHFDTKDVDTKEFAKTVEQQQRDAQYRVLKELERRAL